jgi:hypothetical protein
MRPFRVFLSASILLSSVAAATSAQAAACASGGTLTITASSDSLTLAPTAATTFNFGEHVILTAAATGFTIATHAWTVEGPTIKDYNEYLGTKDSPAPATPIPWSTTALAPADLSAATVGFYFVPAAAQFEPNNGPFARNISLTVTKSGGGDCTVSISVTVERNVASITRQAEDFYTSNHRATTATNPLHGRIVDEHIYWHQSVGSGPPTWLDFLAWHGEFLRRFDTWRELFGYRKVTPWYPGRPLPTGPQFDADAGLRQVYVADNNRIPTYYTITGGTGNDPNVGAARKKLADYASLAEFNGSFEGNFHGQVHCNIGANIGSFFGTSGVGYGSMCNASSPKDPMFWRWHGFIDVMYRNFCALHPGFCPVPSPTDPSADPWMADNATDISNNGTVPSPGTHWISPDVWNRRTLVATDACVQPLDANGNHDTTGGVVRNCGSDADHENPVAGVTNFLYGTLRNTRPGSPRVVYAEVGVYFALASSGFTYPSDFTFVPQSRQFIALHVEPGTTTAIGPIPWTPPAPPPANDHYCLYMRVLSVQETPPTEGSGIDTDVANSNSLAWRNIKVVPPGDTSPPSFFTVRNIGKQADRLTLIFQAPRELLTAPANVRVVLDEALTRAFRAGEGRLEGFRQDRQRGFLLTAPKAGIAGLQLNPGQKGQVQVVVARTKASPRGPIDMTITQRSTNGIDGGVTLRLGTKR